MVVADLGPTHGQFSCLMWRCDCVLPVIDKAACVSYLALHDTQYLAKEQPHHIPKPKIPYDKSESEYQDQRSG